MKRNVFVGLALLTAGCSGGTDSTPVRADAAAISRGADGDCVRAWNAGGNEANRSAAAGRHDSWSVSVTEFVVNHPGPGFTGSGCSYVFHSSNRWQSYGGSWEVDGDLRWDTASQGGRRTPEQHLEPPNAALQEHGTLVRLPVDHGRPVDDPEWRAVIDDWYDDGELDDAHRCGAVREALARLPMSRPEDSGRFDEIRRHAEQVC